MYQVLSLAFMAKPGQALIVPAGNEKEAALILAKPGHEGCGIFPVDSLSDVIDFFGGKRKLEQNQKIRFEDHIEPPVDFGQSRSSRCKERLSFQRLGATTFY